MIFNKATLVEYMDIYISENLGKYFKSLSEIEQDVISKSLGIVKKINNEVSKEDIRSIGGQVSKKNDQLLRFEREDIQEMLSWNLTPKLKEKMPRLYNCFYGDEDFYNFLGLISEKDKNGLADVLVPYMDKCIMEDLDECFDSLSEIEQNVLQRIWGFVEKRMTLEEIGKIYGGLSRERIRQISWRAFNKFGVFLRFEKEEIWGVLSWNITPKLKEKMLFLYNCFYSEKDFYNFLGLISGKDKNTLMGYIYPNTARIFALLNTYFAENGGPILLEEIIEYLSNLCTANNDLDLLHLDELREVISPSEQNSIKNYTTNALYVMQNKKQIAIRDDYVIPFQLTKLEAIAYVLANHPRGLPWLDIAKLVNLTNCSRVSLSTERPEPSLIAENIFLAGTGIYKHTKFIDFASLNVDELFKEMEKVFGYAGHSVLHLSKCHASSKILKEQDYYVLRYIVKNYGESYGFYFNGKSSSDSVALKPDMKNTTQKDLILEEMKIRKEPLTKVFIAGLLKSKSTGHAAVYLDQLINNRQVVQVDRMLYTVPEIAYKNIDVSIYVCGINAILSTKSKPTEVSIFQECLNSQFSVAYSRYFYASLARFYSKEQNWYRKFNLYSKFHIPYNSLTGVLDSYYDKRRDMNQNIKEIQKHIAITKDTLSRAIGIYRMKIADLITG